METFDGLFDGSDAHRIGEDAMREQFEAFCAGAILMGSNAKSQATDAALSRQVACTDGLAGTVPPAPTFETGDDHEQLQRGMRKQRQGA